MGNVLIERTENEVLPLAACCELSENSRLGFGSKVNEQEPGLLCANLQSTLGMHVSLRETRGGSRIQTWNRYAYVMNDPVDNYDPLGLSCSIYLNNSLNLLNPSQLSAMQSALEGVLAPANADVTVGTTLTNADNIFSITISQNPTAINSHLNPNSTVGYTAPMENGGVSSSSWVFVDVLSKLGASYSTFGQNSLALGIGAGRAGSHEFLHFVLQVGNSGHVSGTPFQKSFGAAEFFGTNPTPSVWNLSKSQISGIQSTCGKKPSPGKGPGGAGGGGGAGGADGQWIFWQPVYGSEGGVSYGTGQWIWWPGGGIFRMSVN